MKAIELIAFFVSFKAKDSVESRFNATRAASDVIYGKGTLES